MTFEIDVGDRTRLVSIDRGSGPGQYRVTVDGRTHDVHAQRTSDYGLSLLVAAGTSSAKEAATFADKPQEDLRLRPVGPSGRAEKVPATFAAKVPAASYEVFVTRGNGRGDVLVSLHGRTAVVTVNGRRARRTGDAAFRAQGEQLVVAPMPGRVVRVLVAPGDEVAARQGVVVVEAMKMENELRAPKGGRVKHVSAVPGTSVEAGKVLVVIE